MAERSDDEEVAIREHGGVEGSGVARTAPGAADHFLAAIVESSQDGIVGRDLDGVVTFWNRGAEEIFGYTAEEMIGNPDLPLPAADQLGSPPEKTFPGGATRYLVRRRRKDGTEVDVSTIFSPVRDEAGHVIGSSAIIRDVSDERRAEESLARAKLEAEAANRELEAFSYSVAHDLRAPLRGIDGFSQALMEDYSETLDEEGRRYLGFIRESAQRMAQLIDDLLALSRVTRADFVPEEVDLSALAHATIGRLRAADPGRRVEVTIREGLMDRGDPRLLAVALDNLLGNAWKFTSKRASAHIEFGADDSSGATAYFVRDDGAGFEMAFVHKLFGVFQRLHALSEFEGTGVGLATVQRIVRRHGGRVWAEGEAGRGAIFHFTLNESEQVG